VVRESISIYVKIKPHVYVRHLLANLILLQMPQNMIINICFSFNLAQLWDGKVLCHLAMPVTFYNRKLSKSKAGLNFTRYRSTV